MYKCMAEDGSITYSQTACKNNQSTEKVMGGGQSNKQKQEDCKYSGQFAQSVAQHMRSGSGSEQTFNQYGGLDALSKSSLAIINYVYSYKNNPDVPINRISSLTIAKCNANSFGSVRCEDFPQQFQNSIFSCDEEQQKNMQQEIMLREQMKEQAPSNYPAQLPDDTSKSSDKKTTKQNEKQRIADCKKEYDEKIERIDDKLRQSYTADEGEQLRAQRRNLNAQRYSECR